MHPFTGTLLGLADSRSSTALVVGNHSQETDKLVVNATAGNIHGFVDDRYADVRQLLRVPLTQPPAGNMR